MKAIITEIRIALLATLLLLVIVSGIYPLLVWGGAQLLLPGRANGSLVYGEHGRLIGSTLLAQPFEAPQYFHPRPSAAGAGYDAANSGGSNLGPLSQKLIDQVRGRVENYRTENNLSPATRIPVDAVTASASGLDPHISVANARLQAARVARTRNFPAADLERLIRMHTEGRQWGVLGDEGVNVLMLNLALDRIKP